MENLTTGGSAFPLYDPDRLIKGMTLRDYFAAKAMIGLMGMERAEQFVDRDGYEMGNEEGNTGTLFVHTKFFVQEAYMIAEMMLDVRNK